MKRTAIVVGAILAATLGLIGLAAAQFLRSVTGSHAPDLVQQMAQSQAPPGWQARTIVEDAPCYLIKFSPPGDRTTGYFGVTVIVPESREPYVGRVGESSFVFDLDNLTYRGSLKDNPLICPPSPLKDPRIDESARNPEVPSWFSLGVGH